MVARQQVEHVRDGQPAVPGTFWRGMLVGLPLSGVLWSGLIVTVRWLLGW